MTFEQILETFNARQSGKEFIALCPAHDDHNPSLSIVQKNGRIRLFCNSQKCKEKDILAAKGLTLANLNGNNGSSSGHASPRQPRETAAAIDSNIKAIYPYADENGNLLFEVVRYEEPGKEKTFRQRRADGTWSMAGVRRVLYNLPAVLAARDVMICEGEKDCQTARDKFGIVATTCPGGAGKWSAEYSEQLRGKNVAVAGHNDGDRKSFDPNTPGGKHALDVCRSLYGVAAATKHFKLPDCIKDLTELAELGFSKDALFGLIAETPLWSGVTEAESLFDTYDEYENEPPLTFAVKGFLQEDGVNAIAGLAGHGKTLTALSIIKALLNGPCRLWNLFDVPRRAERIIYLIPESGRAPFKHRLQAMGLYDEVRTGRLLTRTLSKGVTPSLQDPRLLDAVRGADIVCDTGIRFMGTMESENSANEAAKGLSEDFFALQRAKARTITALFHSPKSFGTQTSMTLENMIRGTGEFGANLSTAWGIKQIDRISNLLHVENLKARDFEPCGAFEIEGRPHIDTTGDFKLYKSPADCGTLAEEQPGLNAANAQKSAGKAANLERVRQWLTEDPEPTAAEMETRFKQLQIPVTYSTIRGYISLVKYPKKVF